MNSLFYNINEDVIEDFTLKGKEDLMKGIIRTPKDTFESFHEDPLRILRAARFASTFNFILHDDLILIPQKNDVRESLKIKVSRERIGVEIEKILTGTDPVGGFSLINEMGIKDIVFSINYQENNEIKHKELDFNDGKWVNSLYRMRKMLHYQQFDIAPLFTAFLSTILESTKFNTSKKKETEELKLFIESIVIGSFKWTSKLSHNIQLIYLNAIELLPLLNFNFDEKSEKYKENLIKLGHWIRNIKDLWEPCIYISSLLYTKEFEENPTELVRLIQKTEFFKVIHMKPLLNGNEISKIINQKGKMIGEWTSRLLDWQILQYANKIDENTAKKWIESQLNNGKEMK